MKRLVGALAVAVALLAGGCAAGGAVSDRVTQESTVVVDNPASLSASQPTPAPAPVPAPVQDPYRAMLNDLDIKGRAPMTGYERGNFGQRWSDDVTVEFGHNGCDTRNDILRRDLVDPVIRPGTHGCLVESGTLHEPYTGQLIDFERGDGQVEIDHVVALADAWAKGAQKLDEETRRNFANDPRNLRAVETRANRQKGAGDAATWQPPNKAYRCDYARAQIEVKHAYGLWVTAAEYEALDRELGRC